MTVAQKNNITEILIKEEISEQEAVLLAQELDRLKPVIKQIEEKLKKYCEIHGELKVADGTWRFGTRQVIEADPQGLLQLAEYIKYLGLNPFDYFSINKTSINKLKIPAQNLETIGIKIVEKRGVFKKFKK